MILNADKIIRYAGKYLDRHECLSIKNLQEYIYKHEDDEQKVTPEDIIETLNMLVGGGFLESEGDYYGSIYFKPVPKIRKPKEKQQKRIPYSWSNLAFSNDELTQ